MIAGPFALSYERPGKHEQDAIMIRAEILSRLGLDPLDDSGGENISFEDEARRLLWLVMIDAPLGGHLFVFVVRRGADFIGEAEFQIRAHPRDGRYTVEHMTLGEASIDAPLPAACDLVRDVREAIKAERLPDLRALALVHLGGVYQEPPFRILPPPNGDFTVWVEDLR